MSSFSNARERSTSAASVESDALRLATRWLISDAVASSFARSASVTACARIMAPRPNTTITVARFLNVRMMITPERYVGRGYPGLSDVEGSRANVVTPAPAGWPSYDRVYGDSGEAAQDLWRPRGRRPGGRRRTHRGPEHDDDGHERRGGHGAAMRGAGRSRV